MAEDNQGELIFEDEGVKSYLMVRLASLIRKEFGRKDRSNIAIELENLNKDRRRKINRYHCRVYVH